MLPLVVSLEHPVDLRSEPFVYITVTFVVLSLICILLRAWAQWGTERAWSSVLIMAWIFTAADGALNIALLRYGFGASSDTVIMPDALFLLFRLVYAISIVYPLVLGLAKLSVLQFYLKIFEVHTTKIWITALAAVSIAAALANCFVVIFQCSPIRVAWGGAREGKCVDIVEAFKAFAIINLVLDIIIPIVPAFGVAKLQGDVSKRALAILMLILGSTVVVASSIRLAIFTEPIARPPPNRSSARLTLWSAIEASVAVISACLPLLRPLMRKLVYKIKTISQQSEDHASTRWLTKARNSREKSSASQNTSNTPSFLSAECAQPVEICKQ